MHYASNENKFDREKFPFIKSLFDKMPDILFLCEAAD